MSPEVVPADGAAKKKEMLDARGARVGPRRGRCVPPSEGAALGRRTRCAANVPAVFDSETRTGAAGTGARPAVHRGGGGSALALADAVEGLQAGPRAAEAAAAPTPARVRGRRARARARSAGSRGEAPAMPEPSPRVPPGASGRGRAGRGPGSGAERGAERGAQSGAERRRRRTGGSGGTGSPRRSWRRPRPR